MTRIYLASIGMVTAVGAIAGPGGPGDGGPPPPGFNLPEPGVLGLLLAGVGAAYFLRRKR